MAVGFQVLDPLEFLAEFTQPIPPKGSHLIRYYGWYSNKARGMRRKAAEAEAAEQPGAIASSEASEVATPSRSSQTGAMPIKRVYDFNPRRLDRYLVVANEGGIEPVVVLSKTDLVTPEELGEMIEGMRNSGITARVLPISNMTGDGFEEFRDVLTPGKTTVINRLLGGDVLDTQAVSGTGEGVHTTTRRQLLVLDSGAMLVTDQFLSGMAHNFVYARLIAGEVQSGAGRWGLWGRGRGRAFV